MLRFEQSPSRPESRSTAALMLRALLIVSLGLAAILLAGCTGTRGGPIPYDVKNFGPPDSQTAAAPTLEPESKIVPLDTLRIKVFQVQDLSGDFQVDLLGNLDLPLVGTVKAADMTVAQLDEEISRRLGEKYLRNPDVSIGLVASARRQITVDGSVLGPGQYPMTGPTTLMQAIAMARGVTQEANPHRIAIFRQIDGKRMAAAFDLTEIRKGRMEDPQVYNGDIIIVDGSKIAQIQRQLLQTIPIVGLFNPLIY
jgi:polysaccharide export outer membrane protein